MEEVYENLKNKGKNNLDGVIEWMKEAKIIDGEEVTEDQIKKEFNNTEEAINYEDFKKVLDKLAADSKSNVDNFVARFFETGSYIESAFEKLKSNGKTGVDDIVQWMKESKIIDAAKESEERARKALADVKDKKDVTQEKFKEAVKKVIEDNKNQVKEVKEAVEAGASQMASRAQGVATLLMQEAPRYVSALGAAKSAFQEALAKKD